MYPMVTTFDALSFSSALNTQSHRLGLMAFMLVSILTSQPVSTASRTWSAIMAGIGGGGLFEWLVDSHINYLRHTRAPHWDKEGKDAALAEVGEKVTALVKWPAVDQKDGFMIGREVSSACLAAGYGKSILST
jgi:hypothetical protein